MDPSHDDIQSRNKLILTTYHQADKLDGAPKAV